MDTFKKLKDVEICVNIYPGFARFIDRNNVFCFTNKKLAISGGWGTPDRAIGKTDFDIPSPAVKLAETFRDQNKKVMNSLTSFKFLDFYRWADNFHFLNVCKIPVKSNNNECIGLITIGNEITDKWVGKLMQKLRGVAKEEYKSILLTLAKNDPLGLNKFEKELLFFMLQGLSAQKIADLYSVFLKLVEACIEKIMYKFGVFTVSELEDKAEEMGYLFQIPETLYSKQLSIILDEKFN